MIEMISLENFRPWDSKILSGIKISKGRDRKLVRSKIFRTYHYHIFFPSNSPSQTHPSTYTELDCSFSFHFIFHLLFPFSFSATLSVLYFLFVIYAYISCVFCRSFSLRRLLHSLAAIFLDSSLPLSRFLPVSPPLGLIVRAFSSGIDVPNKSTNGSSHSFSNLIVVFKSH